jgi:hypothetical protein
MSTSNHSQYNAKQNSSLILSQIRQQLAVIQTVLAFNMPSPIADSVFHSTTEALRYAFGDIRCLFYVSKSPLSAKPLELIPCPARQLAPDLYLYDPLRHNTQFQFETEAPYYAPLERGDQTFGYLFVEIKQGQPLDAFEQSLTALLATQVASHLDD